MSEAKPAVCEVAAELLGRVLAEDGGARAAEDALTAHAAGGEGCLVDVALAIALAAGEHGLTTDRFDYSPEAVAAHIGLLRTTGIHDLAEVEIAAARSRLPWDQRGAAESGAEHDGTGDPDVAGGPEEGDPGGEVE
jgi:hypothetical protein